MDVLRIKNLSGLSFSLLLDKNNVRGRRLFVEGFSSYSLTTFFEPFCACPRSLTIGKSSLDLILLSCVSKGDFINRYIK